jgi:hypothetical protein
MWFSSGPKQPDAGVMLIQVPVAYLGNHFLGRNR